MTKPTPTCSSSGQTIEGTVAWIGRDAFHIFCTEDAGLLSANEEITRLRSRVAELENGLTDTLSMLRAAHMQCGIHHAGNKRVIKARSLLSQSTENGNG